MKAEGTISSWTAQFNIVLKVDMELLMNDVKHGFKWSNSLRNAWWQSWSPLFFYINPFLSDVFLVVFQNKPFVFCKVELPLVPDHLQGLLHLRQGLVSRPEQNFYRIDSGLQHCRSWDLHVTKSEPEKYPEMLKWSNLYMLPDENIVRQVSHFHWEY